MSDESSLVNTQTEACLATWGISFLEEWDLLVFLQRHQNSLLTVENISVLLGAGTPAIIRQALKKWKQRASSDVRAPLREFVFTGCLSRLMRPVRTLSTF